jgi:hypothetical protein
VWAASGRCVYPRWRRDGKELYYLNLAGDMMAATVALEAATLETGTPVTLFQQRLFADGIPIVCTTSPRMDGF